MALKTYLGTSGILLNIIQIALVAGPSFILFGYNQAGIGGLLTEEDWVKTFPQIDTVHSEGSVKKKRSTLQGFVVATFVLGAVIGSLSCSETGDRFGRRNVIFFAGICVLIGQILEASSFGLAQFIVGRIILGFGVGQLSSIVPVWLSETTQPQNRGRFVILTGVFTCIGFTLESWIDLGFFEFKTGPITWRPPIAIGAIFSLVLISSVYALPESPRWLVLKGNTEAAAAVISAIHGISRNSLEVESELSGIEHSLEVTAHKVKFSDMFRMGEDKLFYRFMLCLLLQFYQQMCGANLVSVYTTILFQNNLGMDSETSRIVAGGALTWKLLSTSIAFITIDRFGRRVAFILSGSGMSACMIALAITTSFDSSNRPAIIAAGCFIYLYNTFMAIGFMGASFLYCTEVAPVRLRVAMTSISTANHWLWAFVVIMVTPIAFETIHWKYFLVFAVIAACIPISVYILFPETAMRNLEEIHMLFKESPSVLSTVNFAKKRPIATVLEFSSEKGEVNHVERET